MNRFRNIFFGLCALMMISCATDPGFGPNPEIAFISFSKDTMVQNSLNTDSTFLTISFRDGDGNIGSGSNDVTENIRIVDMRTGFVFDRFKIPEIPLNGLESGVEGEIIMKVFTSCCIFPDGTPPCFNPPNFPDNELQFEIEMIDDDGNSSNKITTESIILLCD